MISAINDIIFHPFTLILGSIFKSMNNDIMKGIGDG